MPLHIRDCKVSSRSLYTSFAMHKCQTNHWLCLRCTVDVVTMLQRSHVHIDIESFHRTQGRTRCRHCKAVTACGALQRYTYADITNPHNYNQASFSVQMSDLYTNEIIGMHSLEFQNVAPRAHQHHIASHRGDCIVSNRTTNCRLRCDVCLFI